MIDVMAIIYGDIYGTYIDSGYNYRSKHKKRKLYFFDRRSTAAIKGVAILIVVLCHYMGTYDDGITIFIPLGGIGVSIFCSFLHMV